MKVVHDDEFVVTLRARTSAYETTPCGWVQGCPRTEADGVIDCGRCPAHPRLGAVGCAEEVPFEKADAWWKRQKIVKNW